MAAAVISDLQKCLFFSDFSSEELAELLPYVREESCNPKEIICAAGHSADRAFFLLHGEALEKKTLTDGLSISGAERAIDSCLIRRYGAGQHIALQSLLSLSSVSGSIVANSACQLLTLSSAAFENIQQNNAGLACKIMKGICQFLSLDSERAIDVEIKNSLLIEQMRVEKKKIKAMHRIANSTTLGSVKNTLETILDACLDCLAVEKGSVMIHDKGYLRVEAAFGPDRDEIVGKIRKITNASVSGRCFMSQKPIFMGDIEGATGLERAGDGGKYSNNSVLSLPLVSLQGVSIGVLNVSKTSNEIFTEKDLNIVKDLAQEASTALAHEIYLARIFKKFQEVYVDIRRGREQMEAIEQRICDGIGVSWADNEKDMV